MGHYVRLAVVCGCVLGAVAAFVGSARQSDAGSALMQLGMGVSLAVIAYLVVRDALERYEDEEDAAAARVEELQRRREERGRPRL